jgi:DNA photolyase
LGLQLEMVELAHTDRLSVQNLKLHISGLELCMRAGSAVAAAALLRLHSTHGLIVRQIVLPGSLHSKHRFVTTSVLPGHSKQRAMTISADSSLCMAATNICVWFRNDLRVDDNYALAYAAHEASKAKTRGDQVAVLPIYCFDPELYERATPWGSRKTGAFRARFLIQSVADLRDSLRKLGSDLCISTKSPAEAIAQLLGPVSEGETRIVVCHKEVTSEEAAVDSLVEKQLKDLGHDAGLKKLWGSTLYHPAGMLATVILTSVMRNDKGV